MMGLSLNKISPMKKNTWLPVDQHPELLIGQYIVPNFVSNSIAIQLCNNEALVISPGESLLTPFLQHFNKDIKLHIIFPNSYHHMGVKSWLERFNNVTLYASRLAAEQLKNKGFSDHTILALEDTLPPLPLGYQVLFPPGHKAGDIWLSKQSVNQETNEIFSTWITCDSFLNYQRLSNQPIARFMQKLLGAAPGLKMSQVVKWFILDNRKSFKTWALAQLKSDNPTTLLPSHGEVRHDAELSKSIRQVISQRL